MKVAIVAAFLLARFKLLNNFRPFVISNIPLTILLEKGFKFKYLLITVEQIAKKITIPKILINNLEVLIKEVLSNLINGSDSVGI